MMNNVINFFNPDYFLVVPSESIYEPFYLYSAILVLVLTLMLKIYLRIHKRSVVYRRFDKRWFWGFLTFGFLGLFVWFSRSQQLSTFGTRLASYLWILSVASYVGYLVIYYKKKTVREVLKYNEKKRKEKYLKR